MVPRGLERIFKALALNVKLDEFNHILDLHNAIPKSLKDAAAPIRL